MKKHRFIVTLLLIVAALSMGLVATAQDEAAQVYREGFNSGCSPTTSLDTGCAHRLDIYVNEPLVAITWQGELKPMLAESYETADNGKIWTFNLRHDVLWHDGEAFNADDVIFSFNAYVNPTIGSRRHVWANQILGYQAVRDGEADTLEGVRKIDDYTVEVELTEASPIWLKIRGIYFVMLPEHILGQMPEAEVLTSDFWLNRVGTGPFMWTEYVPDQYIKLTKNENYYLGTPQLDEVILQMYADASTMLADLESGALDTTWYEGDVFSPEDAKRIDELDGIDVVNMDKGSPAFLRLNHEMFSDVRVRQAIRYALDINLLMDTIYFEGGQPAYTMFTQDWAIPGDLNTYEYDPDKARELLAEAGWDSSQEVELSYRGSGFTTDLMTVIQQFLADVGMNVVPRQVDAATITDQMNNMTLNMQLAGYGLSVDPSIGDAGSMCGNILSGGYCNEDLDALYLRGANLPDGEERAEVYQEIARILNEDLPSIWLWYEIRPIGFNRRVVGPYEHWSEQPSIYFNLPVYNEIETWHVASE
ncbi:ABC transporter substrate-binding protein [Phototrophicus methaneseepsis]|uniref:ABC transporter substrate-binding protein n=1 Tax=Phototrophicus methaneseepsis TaxID=2710758 RepID=A0A7S8E536_9CHLR|nr:ABC transporter substrate-binding protein [Phototrophicus methaneseepsis]QPC80526.1 ABC transporter substrate-binding protein [Phototrophicus methaneseepsis]